MEKNAEQTQINKVKNKRKEGGGESLRMQQTSGRRKQDENSMPYKFESLGEMDQSLEKYGLPKLTRGKKNVTATLEKEFGFFWESWK